jgi:hypothetical protein
LQVLLLLLLLAHHQVVDAECFVGILGHPEQHASHLADALLHISPEVLVLVCRHK